jgi:hypothetical protein
VSAAEQPVSIVAAAAAAMIAFVAFLINTSFRLFCVLRGTLPKHTTDGASVGNGGCRTSFRTSYGDRTRTSGLRIRRTDHYSNEACARRYSRCRPSKALTRCTAEQCPPVDSNHAPSGSEPGALSAELDGLMKLVDAVGIEPTMPESTGFTGRLPHLRPTPLRGK